MTHGKAQGNTQLWYSTSACLCVSVVSIRGSLLTFWSALFLHTSAITQHPFSGMWKAGCYGMKLPSSPRRVNSLARCWALLLEWDYMVAQLMWGEVQHWKLTGLLNFLGPTWVSKPEISFCALFSALSLFFSLFFSHTVHLAPASPPSTPPSMSPSPRSTPSISFQKRKGHPVTSVNHSITSNKKTRHQSSYQEWVRQLHGTTQISEAERIKEKTGNTQTYKCRG